MINKIKDKLAECLVLPIIIGILLELNLDIPIKNNDCSHKGENMKTNLLPQTRLFLGQCLLTMILAVSFTDAQAQRRGPGHGGQAPQYPGAQQQILKAQVNTYLSQGQEIGLSRLLKLKQALKQGKKLVSLTVKAQSTQYNSKIVLKLNGQRLQAKSIGMYNSNTTFQLPRVATTDVLSIKVNGGAFIQSVQAVVTSKQTQQAKTLKVKINHQSQGTAKINVKQKVKQQTGVKLQGLKVSQVILKATSSRGNAKATLLINGVAVGQAQTILKRQTNLVFSLSRYAQNIIGQDISSIQIKLKGKVKASMVGVKTVKKGRGPRGRL